MEERDGIDDLDGVVGRGDAADQDAVDGGGGVFEGVENEFDVSVLCNLVFQIAASHVSVDIDFATRRLLFSFLCCVFCALRCWCSSLVHVVLS